MLPPPPPPVRTHSNQSFTRSPQKAAVGEMTRAEVLEAVEATGKDGQKVC